MPSTSASQRFPSITVNDIIDVHGPASNSNCQTDGGPEDREDRRSGNPHSVVDGDCVAQCSGINDEPSLRPHPVTEKFVDESRVATDDCKPFEGPPARASVFHVIWHTPEYEREGVRVISHGCPKDYGLTVNVRHNALDANKEFVGRGASNVLLVRGGLLGGRRSDHIGSALRDMLVHWLEQGWIEGCQGGVLPRWQCQRELGKWSCGACLRTRPPVDPTHTLEGGCRFTDRGLDVARRRKKE